MGCVNELYVTHYANMTVPVRCLCTACFLVTLSH